MKILLVIDNLNSGGAQRQIVNLGLGLKEYGHEVRFLIYNKGAHFEHILERNQIKVHKFFKKSKYDLAALYKAMVFMKKGEYDAIGAFLFVPSLYVLLFKMVFRSKTKILVSERSYHSKEKEGLKERLIRKLYVFADVISANSMAQTNFLIASYPKFENKIVYIPNGLNLADFKVRQTPKATATLRIICVGNVNANKNTKLLIEALRILGQDHGIDAQVQWLGRTEEFLGKENAYFEACKEVLNQYHLEHNWHWAGKVKDVQQLLLGADLLVHPSIGEGFPNAICEALACGLPVIASRVNDHPTIIKDHVNGFLFESDNVDSLADKLVTFKNLDLETRARMQLEARKTAEQKFELSKMIATYNENFKS